MTSTITRYRRGDLSPCGKLKFWGYQSQPRKSDGLIGEVWVSKHSYEAKKERINQLQELARAKREFNRMQSERRAA